jgi:hypothetical protein
MPLSRYDAAFGGAKGAARKAHAAMVAKYGADKADRIFYGKVNRMKKKKKSVGKAYGKAAHKMWEAARALPTPAADVTEAAALLEDLHGRGLTAIQDGDLSFEAVTAAVHAAVTESVEDDTPCSIVATFLGTCVYEQAGAHYQVDYKIVDGAHAVLDGVATTTTNDFALPVTRALGESREAPLIEARPAGSLRAGQLNRAMNVIENTVLITAISANGAGAGKRRYSDTALKQIAERAEGLPAYLNHVPNDQAFKPRDVKDLIGVHRNIRYFPAEGKITSDLHVMEHQAPLVFGLAEKLGDVVGNSLVSRGLVQMEGDTEVVREIAAVRSADLVSDPASTKGLFESRAGDPDPFATLVQELREALIPLKEAPMDFAAMLTFLKDKPDQQDLLANHLGFVAKSVAGKLQESVATLTGERDALTAKVAALDADKAKLAADFQEAKVTLDGYKAKDALAEKRLRVVTAIEAHDLGKQFGKIKEVVSDDFKGLMEGLDESLWAKYLDERFKSLKSVAAAGGTPTSAGKPASLVEEHQNGPISQDIYEQLARQFA